MPLLLLLVLIVALLPDSWPLPPAENWLGANPSVIVTVTWGGVLVLLLAAIAISQRTRHTLAQHPEKRESILNHYANWRFGHLLAMIIFFGLALYVVGWGWVVQSLSQRPIHHEIFNPDFANPADWFALDPRWAELVSRFDQVTASPMIPGSELLILAPFLVGLVLSWTCFYDAERAIHLSAGPQESARPFWSRRAYVFFHVRNNLALVIAPFVLMMVQKALRFWLPEEENKQTVLITAFVLLVVVFITLPWVLRLILGLKPLPDGPLRDRLMVASRRLNFRCSNVLLWNTHGGVGNAMVAGVLPVLRYVLLTDRLVSELTPDEIEAVFGHEVGHVKHHHVLYYLGFFFTSMLAVGWIWDWAISSVPLLQSWLPPNEEWTMVPFVGLVGVYIFLVFGLLSRRCERQADIYGCRAVSCDSGTCKEHEEGTALVPRGRGLCPTGIRTFIDALEKVGQVNGMSRSKPGWLQSWQHSTIARRVEFLSRVLQDRREEARFQRNVGLFKWGLVVVLTTVLIVLAQMEGWEKIVRF